MTTNKIILWEYQKKRVCEFYGCSDSYGNQYPACAGMRPEKCLLYQLHRLLDKLNEPCEHSQTQKVCIGAGKVGVKCIDCYKLIEKEC